MRAGAERAERGSAARGWAARATEEGTGLKGFRREEARATEVKGALGKAGG